MAALQSIGGLISGLQTEDIITKLTEFKKQPVDLLTAQKTKLTEKLTAWQNVNARMLAVKLKAADLQNASAFNAKQVVSSNTSALSVSASDTATVGSYRIKIVQLAQAHQLGSAISYANLTGTALGTGSITIKNVSSGASTIVDIATGADSLTAVRDAINASGADVVANIVNDGTTTPYRLVLTSASTGLDGEMEITTNLTGGAGLAFDGATSEITAAQNAEVTMGTTNPITIESSTNTITTLISGVSLNLLQEDAVNSVLVTVSADSATVVKKVQDFVSAYNDYNKFVAESSSYDPETLTSGALLGDYTLLNAQADLASLLTSNVKGLTASERGWDANRAALSALSGLGIRVGSDGDLSLDEAILQAQLAADPSAVAQVMGRSGRASDSTITFLSAGSKTLESLGAGYAINITQAAAQSRLTAGIAVGTLAQDETLTINGVNITLTTGMDLSAVVAAINKETSSAYVTATATQADGSGTGSYLTLTSVTFGSGARISARSSASVALGNTSGIGTTEITESSPIGESGAGTADAGVDVQGTINGELAVGSGKILTGSMDNANTGGLSIYVDSTTAGDKGFLTYSRGVMAGINDVLANLTDSTDGALTTAQTGVQTLIDDIDTQVLSLTERLDMEIERIRTDFAVLESTLSKIKSQGDFLTAQFASMNASSG